MAVGRGFLVSKAHISMLKKLRPGVRSAVLGAAFARAFELDDCDAPEDEFGLLSSLADAVAADALDFDERGEERRRRDADRQRSRRTGGGEGGRESENVTRTKSASSGRGKRHADRQKRQCPADGNRVRRTRGASIGREKRPA